MKSYSAILTTVRSGAPGMSLPGVVDRQPLGGLLLPILSILLLEPILLIEEGGL